MRFVLQKKMGWVATDDRMCLLSRYDYPKLYLSPYPFSSDTPERIVVAKSKRAMCEYIREFNKQHGCANVKLTPYHVCLTLEPVEVKRRLKNGR